ncbi:uncharacterized protein PV07_09002 [Cladophialophora immunda]|uniref:Zn(2)-C6 fungal-type domain-containing protein n=1 Tax=Cladophialophora immunda TaxID=569365 RepID=A0A0D1ZDP2_9EURO|nr:uncharacterized protein PV07_09002 [Cladophialophora immunda]KIW25866.1 hypothetical protein PV07_09002 [Cladophialophora immunda]OQV09909.1 Fungal specific transcription factor domain-containing protein [Cladophialophora immunda]
MRATACTKCRQVKARCNAADQAPAGCSRCQSLGIACVYDPSFKRTSKAKLMQKMASEIRELRQALRSSSRPVAAADTAQIATDEESLSPPPTADLTVTGPAPAPTTPATTSAPEDDAPNQRSPRHPPSTWTVPQIPSPCRNSTELLGIPPQSPQTTSPGQASVVSVATNRSIGTVSLTASQVAEIFKRYFARYHQHLPFKMTDLSADAIYASSPLLFWVVCTITSPSLQPTLAPIVKSLVEEVVHTPKHSVQTVQALLLLCIWPFRVSFLSDDFSYFYSTMATQIGLQLGLHRSMGTHTYRHSWDVQPMPDQEVRLTTWMACFVVDRIQATMRGVPPSLLADPQLVGAFDDPDLDRSLTSLCRILHTFTQGSLEMSYHGPAPSGLQEPTTRLNLMRLYTERLTALNRLVEGTCTDALKIVYLYCRVQVQAYVLQDDVTATLGTEEMLEMIRLLEEDVCDLVDLCNSINLAIGPGHARVAMTYAGFVLARILQTPYSGRREVLEEKLKRAIQALGASAPSQDDVVNKVCLMFQGLPYMSDLKRSPPLLTRMAAWVSYDSRRIFWENWAQMRPDQDLRGGGQFELSPAPTAAAV